MKVLIADKYDEHGLQQINDLGFTVTLDPQLSNKALLEAIRRTECDALVVRSTRVTADMIEQAPSLRLIIRAGSGYNTIDVDAARSKGISVANCPGMNATAVAELAFGLMLALDRRIVENVVDLRQGVWNKMEYAKARGLKGRTLGIVGLGRIGYLIARRAAAFEMNLIYSDVVPNKSAESELGMTRLPFEDLLGQSDFVTLHVPLDDSTQHMINDARLALMKPGAFLVNCSRGGVIDSEALVRSIDAGHLGGAGLDVYEQEPGPHDTSFTDSVARCRCVYGTHHIGASTQQAQQAVADETARILEHFKNTGDVLNCVNR